MATKNAPISLVRNALLPHLAEVGSTKVVVSFRNRRGTDSFNDPSGAYDPVTGELKLVRSATSDPGKAPRLHEGRIKTNSKGVGRIQCGFHPSVFSFGYHNNDRTNPCLKHDGPMPVERFKIQWLEWIFDKFISRSYNCHRAARGGESTVVGDWSHGCLVFALHKEHWAFLLYMGYPMHGLPEGIMIQPPEGGRFHVLILDVTDVEVDWTGFRFETDEEW